MQCNPQKRTSRHNMILRRSLLKIFQRFQRPWNLLHLVKNDQRVFRIDLKSHFDFQHLNNSADIKRFPEHLCHSFVFIHADISTLLIMQPAELFHQPGFAYLPRSPKDQRLPVRRAFPRLQLSDRFPVHLLSPFATAFFSFYYTQSHGFIQ